LNIKLEKLVATLFIAMLTLSAMATAIPQVLAQTPEVRVEPASQEFGPANCIGTEFSINVVVADVIGLYGIDIQFAWDTDYLLYLNHTPHIPKDDYTDGILWKPGMFVTDVVDPVAGTYAVAYACMDPAPVFDGTGIAFDMWFRITDQPDQMEPDVILNMDITSSDLSDKPGYPIPHDKTDGEVIIHHKPIGYPPEPLLKVMPEAVTDIPADTTFDSSVYLMAVGGGALDPFWDVAGFDVYMNFKRADPPYMLIEAVSITIDPDGWFAAFWPNGIFEIDTTINNVEGWVHVAFMGLPGVNGTHTAPYGSGRIFAVTFKALLESDTFPPPTVDITLRNPRAFVHRATLHADAGLINLATPVGTDWHAINAFDFGTPFSIIDWTDTNADSEMSAGDHLNITDTDTGLWHNYILDEVKGTLGSLEQQPFPATDDYLAMDCPTHKYSPWPKIIDTGGYFNGWGLPYFTGNFSCTYPVDSVNSFEVFPQIGAPYTLTEGVDFVVNPDGTINLLTALDERVENELIGTMPVAGAGWPAIAYIASGFESVWLDFNNVSLTNRYAINNGYCMGPPSEYWFDPDFPYELESYWATGYYPGPWVWPDGTDIYINYSVPAFVTIDYNAFPDPEPYYFELDGTYADFLAALADPVGTHWDEIYPSTLLTGDFMEWSDEDTSGDITIGDYITMESHIGNRTYLVNGVSTDLIVDQIREICDDDPAHKYYGLEPIVEVAGFPQPDMSICPWHGEDSSVGLPHVVEDGTFETYFKPPGAWIDLYTQYPDGFNGKGPGVPSDMVTPQGDLFLYAEVTYNFWPEQNKDVAFEVKDPHMNVWGIFYARTNTVGIAWVNVRLPWPCDDPDYYRGEWHVYATVDVAGKTVNDTMNFKYDYLVNIWKVTTDKDSYAHCEDIMVTIDYGTYAMQTHNITITITVVDETGVPFAWTYTTVIIGGAEYCTYENGTIVLSVHVVKFARAGVAKIYVGALSDFPQNGGSALCPLYTPVPEIGILAEWAI
jgi:hypothetical protein